MRITSIHVATGVMVGLLLTGAAWAAEQPVSEAPYTHGDEATLPNGVIGLSLQVGAERVGDPAVLYVGMVRPEGPAQQAGLRHGDEITAVDGTAVTGKSYEQVVKMIRGEAGTIVRLGVKSAAGTREISITRVASDTLPKGPARSHGSPAR
jgi:predicted metalloprotease with PDZ domain